MRRRTFLSSTAAGLALAAAEPADSEQAAAAEQPGTVSVHWLDGAPPLAETGLSWGVPWPRGAVRKDQTFTLTAADGKALPLQSWPLAYWPDGSLKWSGLATVTGAAGPFRVAPGNPATRSTCTGRLCSAHKAFSPRSERSTVAWRVMWR